MPSLKRSLSCLLLCMLLLSASCSAKAKEFSKDGMHITLTDAFSEGKYYDMTAYYDWEEEDVTVSAMKEEFSVLEENGESTALSLEEYAEVLMEASELTAEVRTENGDRKSTRLNSSHAT